MDLNTRERAVFGMAAMINFMGIRELDTVIPGDLTKFMDVRLVFASTPDFEALMGNVDTGEIYPVFKMFEGYFKSLGIDTPETKTFFESFRAESEDGGGLADAIKKEFLF